MTREIRNSVVAPLHRHAVQGRAIGYWLLVVSLSFEFIPSDVAVRAAAVAAPPNIIYLMVDDMGWGDAGCYGQKHMIRTGRTIIRSTPRWSPAWTAT